MADLVIIAIMLLGAIVGFRRGFVVPLVAQGGALLTLAALYAGPLADQLAQFAGAGPAHDRRKPSLHRTPRDPTGALTQEVRFRGRVTRI